METPTKRLIYFNSAIIAFAVLLGFIFIWPVGLIFGIIGLAFVNTGYLLSRRQYKKLVEHNEKFRKEQEAEGNKVLKLNQKEYDLLIKNKVYTKDGQTIYLEDMVNGNKGSK